MLSNINMNLTKQILLSIFSGLLVMISFPTVLFGWKLPELGFLAWFALVPLFVSIHQQSARRVWSLAFLCGITFASGSLYWIFNAVHHYGGLDMLVSLLVTITLIVFVAAYLALAPCLATVFAKRLQGEMLVCLPVFWTVIEFARNFLPFNGFPWSNIAMSQAAALLPLQFVDICGVYGLIFLLIWVNQFLAEWVLKISGASLKYFNAKFVVTALIIGLVFAYGAYKLRSIPQTIEAAPAFKVGLIQGNIPQHEKWNPLFFKRNLSVHQIKTQQLQVAKVDLIVWPEASYPQVLPATLEEISPQKLGLAKSNASTPFVLLGALTAEKGGIHNSALLFDSLGWLEGIYHKVHLVPFGEYVPYKKLLFFAKKLVSQVGNIYPGKGFEPLFFDGVKLAPLLCYEDIFPEISRAFANKGAHLLINLTNDAWYGNTSAAHQHLALSVFRAVENRRYLVRATNTGVSAIVSPTGQLISQSPLFERLLQVGTVRLLEEKTIYTELGDWFAKGCVLFVGLGFCVILIRRLKR